MKLLRFGSKDHRRNRSTQQPEYSTAVHRIGNAQETEEIGSAVAAKESGYYHGER